MTPLAPPATIAFIGLGMMGRPMATRLVAAGFKLRVFDVSQKAVSDFVGAHPSALATASAKAATSSLYVPAMSKSDEWSGCGGRSIVVVRVRAMKSQVRRPREVTSARVRRALCSR